MNGLECVRFYLDDPHIYGFDCSTDEGVDSARLHRRFISHHVKVTPRLTPSVANAVDVASSIFGVANVSPHAYIVAEERINAACIACGNADVIIWLSSGLVKLLSPEELVFVIGHELGHWYFSHHQYPRIDDCNDRRFLARQQLSRAAEVSADRIGLLACADLDVATRAVVKTASGLPDDYIGKNLSDYLRQARTDRTDDELVPEEAYSTHPPFSVRARAMTWFTMAKYWSDFTKSPDGGIKSMEEINRRVEIDLFDSLGKAYRVARAETLIDSLFWLSVNRCVKDGVLRKEDQAELERHYGEEWLGKLRGFLSGKTKKVVIEEVRSRASDARLTLAAIPRSEVDRLLVGRKMLMEHVREASLLDGNP